MVGEDGSWLTRAFDRFDPGENWFDNSVGDELLSRYMVVPAVVFSCPSVSDSSARPCSTGSTSTNISSVGGESLDMLLDELADTMRLAARGGADWRRRSKAGFGG